jgi:hypothetical protein
MSDIASSTGPANSNASIMARAEAAIDSIGEVDADLSQESEVDLAEPEEDIFGVNEPDDGDESEAEDAAPIATKLGSQAQPYTVKTLPDSFVTLKIDGEEKTVPLREMTDGYMRQEAFHKRMNQVSALTEQAKEAASRFSEQSERFKSSFNALITDPEELFDFMDEHSPEVLDAVARKQLQRMMKWQNDPQARMAHEYEKRQRALEKQRAKLEAERGEYQRTRQEEESHQKYMTAFKPGYDAGMKRAGYPVVTDEFRETVKGLLTARRSQTGADPTSKDIEDAVVRAARAVAADTVQTRKPVPAPAAKPGAKPAPARKQASQPKSFNQLFRDLGK